MNAYGNGADYVDMSTCSPPDDLVVMYAGTISISHALPTVIQAAVLIRDRANIRIVLVGDGPDRAVLMGQVSSAGLTNVSFDPAPASWSNGGHYASRRHPTQQRNAYSMVETDFPAKTVEYLASGRPIISCGQARSVIEESDGGVWVPPEDPAALAGAILRLSSDPAERERLGRNGVKYARTHLNRDDVLRAYEKTLLTVWAQPSRGRTRPAPD